MGHKKLEKVGSEKVGSGRVSRSDFFLDCFLSSLGGGWSAREKLSRSNRPSYGSSTDFFFPRGKIRPIQVCVGHNMLQFTFSARARPTRHGAPCTWVACRGHVYDRTPLAAVCRYRRPKASLWHALWTDHTRCNQKKKGNAQKSQHRNTLWFTCAGRVQSKLDNMLRFWDASRGYE